MLAADKEWDNEQTTATRRDQSLDNESQAPEKHLSMMVSHANGSKDYGAHGVGYNSAGAFLPGGIAGADYQTTSVGSATAKIEAVERRQRSNLGSLGTSSLETEK
jgi:hypothetical protein